MPQTKGLIDSINLSLKVLQAGNPKIKVQEDSVPGENLFPPIWWLLTIFPPRGGPRKELSGAFLSKSTAVVQGFVFHPHWNLVSSTVILPGMAFVKSLGPRGSSFAKEILTPRQESLLCIWPRFSLSTVWCFLQASILARRDHLRSRNQSSPHSTLAWLWTF